MARPIRPTPRLDREASRVFLNKVEKERKEQVRPPATPNIDKAIEMIMSDASDRKK